MTIREAIAERIRLAEREHADQRAAYNLESPDAGTERAREMNMALLVLRERINGMRLLVVAIEALLPKDL